MGSRTKRTWKQSSRTVTRPSSDCQTTFFGRFKQFGTFLKKVPERSRDSGRRSRNRRPTVKQRFWMFQATRNVFEKSHWTVTRQWSEVTRLSADCQTTFFGRFKRFGRILKKFVEWSRNSGRRSRDHRPTVKQRFFDVSSNWKQFWKKSLNGHSTVVEGHATVGRLSNNVFLDVSSNLGEFWKKVPERSRESGRRSRDHRPTVKQRFFDVSSNWKFFWKKSLNGHVTVVGGHATVGRLSNSDISTFQAIGNFFEKSRWTVTRQWSEVTRPSADCQTTFFGRFKRFGKILKKVAERSRDSGWGHATVGRLSNNVFWTFQAIWENFGEKKSRWTVTRQWLRSRDRRPTVKQRFLDVSSDLGKFWKKSAERSRDSGRRSRDRRPTVKQRFLDVSSDLGKFWKKSLNGHATVVGGHATVGRLSNNVFWTFQAIRKCFWKNERSRDSGWRSRDRRPTVKQRFLDVSSNLGKFFDKSRWTVRPTVKQRFFGRFKRFGKILKKVAERSRQWRRSRDRRPTVKQRFLDVSSNFGKFKKKSLNGHATVVSRDRRPTVKQRFLFQAIWENFEKSRWTVTRQWSEVTRPSADCQTTFFGRFKRFGKILKKVAERSRDSGRRSRDRRPTVKQRFLDVSSDLGKFKKKSLNGHATVVEVTRPSADCQTTFFGRFKRFGKILRKVAERSRDSGGGHATVGWLSKNVFWTFQAIWENFEKSRWTVTRQWSEVTRPSADCQTTFFDVSSI